METSASLLEDECYKKYGKTGKSFYYSKVASTIRWLKTTSSVDLMNRLREIDASSSPSVFFEAEHPLTPLPTTDPCANEETGNELSENPITETIPSDMPIESSFNTNLPPIPSFAEFVNSKKEKRDRSSETKKHSSRVEKKMRIQ